MAGMSWRFQPSTKLRMAWRTRASCWTGWGALAWARAVEAPRKRTVQRSRASAVDRGNRQVRRDDIGDGTMVTGGWGPEVFHSKPGVFPHVAVGAKQDDYLFIFMYLGKIDKVGVLIFQHLP